MHGLQSIIRLNNPRAPYNRHTNVVHHPFRAGDRVKLVKRVNFAGLTGEVHAESHHRGADGYEVWLDTQEYAWVKWNRLVHDTTGERCVAPTRIARGAKAEDAIRVRAMAANEEAMAPQTRHIMDAVIEGMP